MNLDLDLNNLDFNNIGSWPVAARAVVIALLCATLLFLGYYLDISDQLLTLEQAEAKEKTLKAEFEKKQAKAANLDAYKEQMQEMEHTFGTLLQQLPGKTEVAEVLVDVSHVGIQTGLEFELFKPAAEIPKEFYAELPIQLRVIGTAHEFGNFVSGIAALPRIVTLHDLTITRKAKNKDDKSDLLIMSATAKTYRYLDEDEKAASNTRKRKGKK
ncbi:MAG TPA: pilus assembly protein PilO [Gammaproteobacteria bacterium]|nr:pilus assembly protein PilO [Gammaproteobacteria bacterium]